MPNMFGGSQHHPSYDPQTKDEPTNLWQCIIGDRQYNLRIPAYSSSSKPEVEVYRELVDGSTTFVPKNEWPKEVRDKAERLLAREMSKNK